MTTIGHDAGQEKDMDGGSFASLRNRKDFLALRNAPRHQVEPFVLQGRLAPCGSGPATALRAGFTITKRVGNAVERNRIRRRLKHALRQALADLRAAGLDPCGDFVLVARPAALHMPFGALADLITKGIDRLVANSNKAAKTTVTTS